MATLFPLLDLPDGFRYEAGWLPAADEARLLEAIASTTFSAFTMRGVVARRRVAFFGRAYDASRPAEPMPAFLDPLRERAAAWAGVDAADLAMALINEYPPGAPIGWHRDAPQYDVVVGVSLLSACRMRLRPYVPPRDRAAVDRARRGATHEITIEPRSIYLLSGPARSAYEHGIPAVAERRYSITLRTLRRRHA